MFNDPIARPSTMPHTPLPGMAVVGLDHRVRWADAALCKLLKYELNELIGRSLEELTHPSDIRLDSHLADRLIAGELLRYDFDKRYIDKTGAIVNAHLSAMVVRDSAGKAIYGIALVQPSILPGGKPHSVVPDRAGDQDMERIRNAILM